MKKTLSFDFCEMTIHNQYIVSVIKEGINVMPKHNDLLIKVADTYFKNKPFVYITHRINSYSVDPKVYHETSKIKNLKGCAVVSSLYQATINVQIEKMFFSKPFESFETLEAAFQWADTLLQ